jgi:hypothetical protein
MCKRLFVCAYVLLFYLASNISAEPAKQSLPKMPSGPSEPRPFGAYYTRLHYTPEWDKPWRVGDYADVVVRFDDSPVKFVFWRGISYAPCWVTENDIWHNTQFYETGDNTNKENLMLECDSSMDLQCRYSHVRILENTPARVVIHWRYAASFIDYTIAFTDESTGWGDWVDEYYTIYPDGSCIRKITCWSSVSYSEGWGEGFDTSQGVLFRQYDESIIFFQAGTKPEDSLNLAALTVANLKGENKTFVWDKGAPEPLGMPENSCIKIINVKAKYKPYSIFEPNNVVMNLFGEFWGQKHAPDTNFQCWGHWPVSSKEDMQHFLGVFKDMHLKNTPESQAGEKLFKLLSCDRPTHTSVAYTFWDPYEKTDHSFTKIFLNGLSNKPLAETVSLAKSWINPPELKVLSEGLTGKGFDKTQKAYILACEKSNRPSKLKMKLAASKENPIFNPAFVIQNWGESHAKLRIDGKDIKQGKDFKIGHNRRLEGTDLIIWIKKESEKPLKLEMIPLK